MKGMIYEREKASTRKTTTCRILTNHTYSRGTIVLHFLYPNTLGRLPHVPFLSTYSPLNLSRRGKSQSRNHIRLPRQWILARSARRVLRALRTISKWDMALQQRFSRTSSPVPTTPGSIEFDMGPRQVQKGYHF